MGEQKDALDTALPIGGRYLNNEMRGLFTNSLVALNPFNAQELHDEGGRYYGINQSSGNVVIGNRGSWRMETVSSSANLAGEIPAVMKIEMVAECR